MQVFLTTPWVPPEWIKSHGHEPRGIWWLPTVGLQNASIGAGVCAFAQSVCGLAETHPGVAIVFSTHCDQLRRGFDTIPGFQPERAFLFNLPATWQTPVSRQLFASELTRLGEFLCELGGRAPAAEDVDLAVAAYDSVRTRLIDMANSCHGRHYAEAVAAFHWDGSLQAAVQAPNRGPQAPSIPLALVGGPLPRTCWDLFDLIESFGGRVVVNGTEAGERSLGRPLAPTSERTEGSPEQMLARRFVSGCIDIFRRPNTHFYEWLSARVSARHVRGILLWHYVGCDLWRAEAQSLREAFGLPVLLLEPSETGGVSARLAGRVQAFLETLQ